MHMKNRLLSMFLLALTLTVGAPFANAVSGTGTVAVTATTTGSVSLTFVTDDAGITLGGSGTSAATIAFGTLRAFGGTVPAGVTFIPSNGTAYGVSTPFDVNVSLSNSSSPDYTLTAALQSSDAVNTWDVSGTTLTTTAQALTIAGTYGTPTPYTFTLSIPIAASAGSISNTMNFVATAN